jgi:hypothetical protein
MSRTKSAVLLLSLVGITTYSTAQQASPNPPAVFQAAIASLNSGSVTSLGLSGTFEAPAGDASETGSFSAGCGISGTSQIQMQLSSGSRTENRQMVSGVAAGNWVDEQGALHQMPLHNVQTPPGWFCPQIALAEILQSTGLAILFIGNETKGGIPVLHYSVVSSNSITLSQLSGSSDLAQTEVYLDAATLKPVAFAFNTHPDDNALVDIPVEIQFDGYVGFDGVLIPGTVTKSINGSVVLTLQISSASPATSISPSN